MPGEQLETDVKQHLIYIKSLRIFPRSEARALVEEWLQEREFAKPRNSMLEFLGLDHAMSHEDMLSRLEQAVYPVSRVPIKTEDHLNYLSSLRIFDKVGDEDWARVRKQSCIQAWLNFTGLSSHGRKVEESVKKALGLGELNSESVGRMLQEAAEKGVSWRHESREKGTRENRLPRFLGGRKTNKSRRDV
ncbi:MAG: hypothetical protein WC488_02100 [Candidatus Micrarchaeia archaeon]